MAQEEKKEILKHIFHLEESYASKHKNSRDLMVDLQECFDKIDGYTKLSSDKIGEVDLLMKLFPSVLRPNINQLVEQPDEDTIKLINYVGNHLEATGKLLKSLYKDVQHEYREQMKEIGQIIRILDPKFEIVHADNSNLKIFLNA